MNTDSKSNPIEGDRKKENEMKRNTKTMRGFILYIYAQRISLYMLTFSFQH